VTGAPGPTRVSLTTVSTEDTESLGGLLAGALRAGDVLLLEGDLGAGKTHLVRGLARGLHLDESQVCSPTFVVMNVYRAVGSPTLVHLDAYRLSGGDDLDAIGFDAATSRPAIVAIEWPSRLEERLAGFDPARVVTVHITHAGEDLRHLTIDLPPVVRSRPGTAALLQRGGERVAATCPITGRPVPADCPTWPFADEHARLADLHRWLSGGYTVSRELTEDDIQPQ